VCVCVFFSTINDIGCINFLIRMKLPSNCGYKLPLCILISAFILLILIIITKGSVYGFSKHTSYFCVVFPLPRCMLFLFLCQHKDHCHCDVQ
jgi:hypothetical protein